MRHDGGMANTSAPQHPYREPHYLAVGKRVENQYDYGVGVVVETLGVETGEVLVQWADGSKTLCWPHDLEPAA